MKVILIGSTGLVGQEVLKLLLADPSILEVVTPARHGQSIHSKQKLIIYDYEKNENAEEFKNADVVICTLGTTMKKAKSKPNFKKVDYDYPLNFANLAKKNGTRHFILNSSMGASAKSPIFYSKIKGEIEESIRALNFDKYSIIRPGLIGGERSEFRLFEIITLKALTAFGFLLPKSLKINPANKIAQTICTEMKTDFNGEQIISSDAMI
ncbi:MAG: NAD(P)H-binding protein [Pseudobdellovibrionaceae bacterium]